MPECKLCGMSIGDDRVCHDCGLINNPPEPVIKRKPGTEEHLIPSSTIKS